MPLRNNGTSRGWLAPATGPTLIKQESKYKIRIEERDSELSFFALVAVTGGRGGKNPRFFPLCPASSCPQTPDNVLENDVRSRQQRRTNDPETIEIIVAFPGSYCRLNRGTRNWSRLAQGEIRRGAGFARKSSLECENQRRQPLVSQLPDRSGCRGTFTRANARKPRMCVCVCVCVCAYEVWRGVEYGIRTHIQRRRRTCERGWDVQVSKCKSDEKGRKHAKKTYTRSERVEEERGEEGKGVTAETNAYEARRTERECFRVQGRARKKAGRQSSYERERRKGEAGKWEREGRRGSKVERRGRESGGKNQ